MPRVVVGPSPVLKASADDYESLHRAADAMVPQMREGFIRSVLRLQGRTTIAQLESAIVAAQATENPEIAVRAIDWQEFESEWGQSVTESFRALIRAGAVHSIHTLGRKLEIDVIEERTARSVAAGPSTVSFNLLDPNAVAWVDRHAAELVREVSDETKLAIRDVVSRGFTVGAHPRQQAREIKRFVGLTSRLQAAVENYAGRLNATYATTHPSWTAAKRAEAVDGQVAKYHQKLLTYRSEMIARTETLRAANEGRRELWRQAEAQGFLDSKAARQRWVITPDDRLCPLCAQMRGDRAVAAFGEPFDTPLGPISAPPLHPACRCVASLFFSRGPAPSPAVPAGAIV